MEKNTSYLTFQTTVLYFVTCQLEKQRQQPPPQRTLQDSILCVLPLYTDWRFINRMNERTKKMNERTNELRKYELKFVFSRKQYYIWS